MRKNQRENKGSITIFAILSLMLVTGCVLMLLEGSRMYELHRLAGWRSQVALESAFGNYSSKLWEQYRLLACEKDAMEEIMTRSSKGAYSSLEYGDNLLLLRLKTAELESYTLLTDGEGQAYLQAVAAYMERNILYETIKQIYNQYESIKALLQENMTDGTEIEKALEALENSGQSARRGRKDTDMLKTMDRMKKTQLLELVVEDTSILSEVEYNREGFVSQRERKTGVDPEYEAPDWMDRGMLQQYFLTYFSDYIHPVVDRGFFYELEYLIGGQDNDVDNMRAVVDELLLIREAANLAYLLMDTEKMEAVRVLALGIAGVSANPVVIALVESALLASWAFAESILDVRALLVGKQIPFIKSRDTWTMSLENIDEVDKGWWVAKESPYGLGYKGYLGVLLLFHDNSELAYRAMDIQELALQENGLTYRMDELVVHAQASFTYKAKPVFYQVDYKITKKVAFGYR